MVKTGLTGPKKVEGRKNVGQNIFGGIMAGASGAAAA